MKQISPLLAASAILILSACTPQPKEKISPLLQHENEITGLIARMTPEEKVNMLHGKHMFSSAGVERLGIADMEYADGPFGIREEMEPHSWNSLGLATDSATFFPTGSALAATWSEELAYRYGAAMAKEARLRGKDMILGPAINIQRLPTGGRTYEYLSEDPLLSAALAVNYTRGAQDNGTAVCLKHYALNNQENHRGSVDVNVSPRAMREIYLPPFEAAVKEADAYGVMAAYNKVGGDWCSENDLLLNRILREEWGFHGMVISDWGGVHSTVKALRNGMNVEMPGARYFGQALLDSVKAGIVPDTLLDSRVRDILRVRFAVQPVAKEEANRVMTSQPEQQQTAYDVAAHSIVLLKNEQALLPLRTEKLKHIAVIGDNAVRRQAQGGVGAGVKALYEITPLEGINRRLQGTGVSVRWAQGYRGYGRQERDAGVSPYTKADPQLLDEAVQLAKQSDLVIFVGGNNREIETEGSDRTAITLPAGQDELLQALAAVNPNVVTVILSGGPVDLRMAQQVSPALLLSWFNGSEGGNALADVLTGKVSPSGKLPFTLPLRLEDSPAYSLKVYPQQERWKQGDIFVDLVDKRETARKDGPVAEYAEGLFVGYRWFDTKQVSVLYPFGHGLSYTSFRYADLQVKADALNLSVEMNLSNTGKADGEEVVQCYVRRPDSRIERPQKELKAFQRIFLRAGETASVRMPIPLEKLRHWDETTCSWQIEPGTVEVLVGSSSQDIRLEGQTTIAPARSRTSEAIRVNQVGYYPHQEKVAVADSIAVREFSLLDAVTGRRVFSGKPAYTAVSPWSDKKRTVLDFSTLTTPGDYLLITGADTMPVTIRHRALEPLADAALKSFYYQRTAMPIEAAYAGQWSRPAGHPDNHVLVHPNAVGPDRPAGTVISSPKGWYDAGDYNKYIVNSAYSIGLMQAVYRLFPDYFAAQSVNIPESSNRTPDFLDEMYYNLSWMLTMQDPADGGVYHKLTTPSFEGFIRPVECRQSRYVVRKSVTAALDFAASMAQASSLFAPYEQDYPGFSRRALAAAERAYLWAEAHPEAFYNQDELNKQYQPPVLTGAYGDGNAQDEFFWAASELYLVTGKPVYREKVVHTVPQRYNTPSWGSTAALGVFAWLCPERELTGDDQALATTLKEMLLAYAEKSVHNSLRTPFHAPYGNDAKDFFWGCLAEKCANQGTSLVYTYLLTGKEPYLTNAFRNMDYLLGRNATGYCYVTGFGTKSPLHPHHRLSASDGIEAPIPGLLVGGPNPGRQDKAAYPSRLPDESYADVEESYASNEIAINWSAALVALASSLDALSKERKQLSGFSR